MIPSLSFTTKYPTISNRLINEAVIIAGEEEMHTDKAQWDTGATETCISRTAVDRLGLIPVGETMVQTPSGAKVMDEYIVDIRLRNNVTVTDVRVMGSEIGGQGIDILIGMDIITLGDFSVSNYRGHTNFSFRIPSQYNADFVKKDGKK